MSQELTFTSPTVVPGDGVRFSAYVVERAFHALLLSVDAACSKLGPVNTEPRQLLLALNVNLPRIARAIDAKKLPSDGRTVVLHARDFV
ncbi:hypothetical protein [Paraburkholderia sp. HD33-4]|uniref:hypothetical protein n=1 Tax=Paraburkholderia sp. HD33-4 TaxID=2883242 RepID=UPI001F2FD9CB|nr:hypothetical protein [Paraburkholderia sp. HD33-4]